jgi:hypothetical protein
MYRRARRADKQPVTVFAERWWQVLPLPLTDHDRTAGYWWEISLRQVEVSRTLVFAAPRHARAFFEALVADNLDIGRPEQLEVIVNRRTRGPIPQGAFKTKVVTRGVDVTVNAFYKHSRIKAVPQRRPSLAHRDPSLNDPYDLSCQRRLHNLDDLPGQGPCRQPPTGGY